MDNQILIDILKKPQLIKQLNNSQLETLISQARSANLLSRLDFILNQHGLLDCVPEKTFNHLFSARKQADKQHSQVHWEVSLLSRTFREFETPLLLLKGSAYIYANLPPSCGRTLSDIDILVPKGDLSKIEKRLFLDGFMSTKVDNYDQRYYREWMHEIPPLQHYKRGTTLDIHHNILPTLKRELDPIQLFKKTICIRDNISILSKSDVILHSAAHLFLEGEFNNGLRDLHDLHLLLGSLNGEKEWEELKERARELKLTLPLFYATRYCKEVFSTSIPSCFDLTESTVPKGLRLAVSDWLFGRVLIPHHHSSKRPLFKLAEAILLARAHCLKMPLTMLIPHLIKKSVSSIFQKNPSLANNQ